MNSMTYFHQNKKNISLNCQFLYNAFFLNIWKNCGNVWKGESPSMHVDLGEKSEVASEGKYNETKTVK